MIGNILVAVIVAWAVVYSSYRLWLFVKSTRSDSYFKCSCSSCPYIKNK